MKKTVKFFAQALSGLLALFLFAYFAVMITPNIAGDNRPRAEEVLSYGVTQEQANVAKTLADAEVTLAEAKTKNVQANNLSVLVVLVVVLLILFAVILGGLGFSIWSLIYTFLHPDLNYTSNTN